MNLLEWMKIQRASRGLTKKKLSKLMNDGTEEHKEHAWKIINELGGYDALLDGSDDDLDFDFDELVKKDDAEVSDVDNG